MNGTIPAPIILKGQEPTVTLDLKASAADKSYPFKAVFKRCSFSEAQKVTDDLKPHAHEDEQSAEMRVLKQQLLRVYNVEDENHNLLDTDNNARLMATVLDSQPYRFALIGGLFTSIHNLGNSEEQREGN